MKLVSKLLLLVLVLTLGIFYAKAWTGPSSAPPEGNVDKPINIGSDSQIKDGDLGVMSIGAFSNAAISGYVWLGGGASLTCDVNTEGALQYYNLCLKLCAYDGSYDWHDVVCPPTS